MIYFVQSGDTDFVKVGYAADVGQRLASLRVASPTPIRLLAIMPGDRKQEAQIHSLLYSQRVRGEWFRLAGATKVALAMAQERYAFDEIVEIVAAFLESEKLAKSAHQARAFVARRRRMLGDLGYGRNFKRMIAVEMPELRKQAARRVKMHMLARRSMMSRIRELGRAYA